MVDVLSSLQFSSVYRQCVGQIQLVQKRLSRKSNPIQTLYIVLLWTATIFCAALSWVEGWLSLEYMVVVLSS